MFLAQHTSRVWLLLRGGGLRRRMSSYLADRVEAAENVTLVEHTEIRRIIGNERMEGVDVDDVRTGETRRIETSGVFSFIGAAPRTDWLPPRVQTDAGGFLLTGRDVAMMGDGPPARPPAVLETSCPGIFAAGDVRRGSAKRVASAVGEGAMAVMFVHQHLAERGTR